MPISRAYKYADYINLPGKQYTWLIKPIIPVGGKVNLYGDSKAGKSYAALQLCAALTGGLPDFLGLKPSRIGEVLYIQLDTPGGLWKERLTEIQSSGYANLSDITFADKDTLDCWPFDIHNPEHWQAVRGEVNRIKPIAVVADVIREFHHGNEDKNDVMKEVIGKLETVSRPAALILIAHSRKPNAEVKPSIINDIRGSNYIPGAVDTIIKLTAKQRGKVGRLEYVGRAAEHTRIPLQRLENGLWQVRPNDPLPEPDPVEEALKLVLKDSSLTSRASQTVKLAELTGLSIAEAKKRLLAS